MNIRNAFGKVIRHPLKAVDIMVQYGKGFFYKGLFKILGKKVKIGKNFRVRGRLSIKGPGRVTIGDNVRCGMLVTPWTHDRKAEIVIGNGVFLNGTRFACQTSITVRDDCILADCRVTDTDFHGVLPGRRDEVLSKPITIERDVWITIGCVVLKGVVIGEGSTVTPLSVVNTNVPPNSLFGGNPARLIKSLNEGGD